MRIQILPLPTVVVGDVVDEQFALVVDQCQYDNLNLTPSSVAKAAVDRLERFGEECFALAVLVTDETVEIVDRHTGPGAQEIDKLADYLLKYFGDEIGEGSAVDNAIRLLGGILLRRDAAKMRDELAPAQESATNEFEQSRP